MTSHHELWFHTLISPENALILRESLSRIGAKPSLDSPKSSWVFNSTKDAFLSNQGHILNVTTKIVVALDNAPCRAHLRLQPSRQQHLEAVIVLENGRLLTKSRRNPVWMDPQGQDLETETDDIWAILKEIEQAKRPVLPQNQHDRVLFSKQTFPQHNTFQTWLD